MTIEVLRVRYVALFGKEPAGEGVVQGIESALGLLLPDDLKLIAGFYSGGILGGIAHYAIAIGGPADNIVDETIRLRSAAQVPNRMVVLAEPAESLIVLNLKRQPMEDAVYWIGAHDVGRLSDPRTIPDADSWETYADFFAYLLNSEEEDRSGV